MAAISDSAIAFTRPAPSQLAVSTGSGSSVKSCQQGPRDANAPKLPASGITLADPARPATLSTLIEEAPKKNGIASDDPFGAELKERMMAEARRGFGEPLTEAAPRSKGDIVSPALWARPASAAPRLGIPGGYRSRP
jgi:hypothetical protein